MSLPGARSRGNRTGPPEIDKGQMKIKTRILDLLRRVKTRLIPSPDQHRISYAQCGEDLIISHVFEYLKIEKPTYLDIGAHDPKYISNTYFFYERGARGVLVEPDDELCRKIRKARSRDICLNVGVSVDAREKADFYVMNSRTLNTFSREEAERIAAQGVYHIADVRTVRLMSVNEIVRQHFPSGPNLISVDVEGLDYEILKSFDFQNIRPEVFCVETLTFTTRNDEQKRTDIIDYMLSRGYFLYADTYINSIFVDNKAWGNR